MTDNGQHILDVKGLSITVRWRLNPRSTNGLVVTVEVFAPKASSYAGWCR